MKQIPSPAGDTQLSFTNHKLYYHIHKQQWLWLLLAF